MLSFHNHTHPGDAAYYDENKNEGAGSVSTIGKPSGSNSWGQPSSTPDISNARSNAQDGSVRGNSYVLGLQGKGKVYIYNGGGSIATFPLKAFLTIK